MGLRARVATVLLSLLRPRRPVPQPAPRTPLAAPLPGGKRTNPESSLDRGVREIRLTDPGFDPSRFTGYAGMMFRDAQRAWMAQDIGSVRDRLTPEMHDALQAQCDRLLRSRQVNRIEEIEITAAVTEAWQESGRDYVTAYISGSLVDYTIDEVRASLVDGSRTKAREVEEFWTFTRPAGLNFWMLSAIQT